MNLSLRSPGRRSFGLTAASLCLGLSFICGTTAALANTGEEYTRPEATPQEHAPPDASVETTTAPSAPDTVTPSPTSSATTTVPSTTIPSTSTIPDSAIPPAGDGAVAPTPGATSTDSGASSSTWTPPKPEKALVIDPEKRNKALPLFNKGVEYTQSNNFAEAGQMYSQALKIDPNFLEARLNWGMVLAQKGDYKNAIVHFNEVLRLDPTVTQAYSNRGVCKRNLNDFQGALTDLDHAVHLEPRSLSALVNRGVTKIEMGDLEGARKDMNAALEIAPRDPRVLNNLEIINEGGHHAGTHYSVHMSRYDGPKQVNAKAPATAVKVKPPAARAPVAAKKAVSAKRK